MSNLNHYIRQLHPRAESYTPHVDKVQNFFESTLSILKNALGIA